MSRVMRKPTFLFPTWSDTNQAVHLQKMTRGLKSRIWEVEGLYYLRSENKGAGRLYMQNVGFLMTRLIWFCCGSTAKYYSNNSDIWFV